MKIRVTLLLLLSIQLTFAKITESPAIENNWDCENLNTAAHVSYLSELEKNIILEINKLRTNPTQYANEYIAPLAKHYKNKMFYYPGDDPILTKEGVRALNECVRILKKTSPLPIIYPGKGLTLAARDHVKDQSVSGKTGHQGSDHSDIKERIERYGDWNYRIAENIAYGGYSTRQIVIYLLIDDGVQNRGHRKNLLHPDFKNIGVAIGKHPKYKHMCVMDFAGAFTDK